MKKIAVILMAFALLLTTGVNAQTKKKTAKKAVAKVTTITKIGTIKEASMHFLKLNVVAVKPTSLDIIIDDNTDLSKAYLMEGNIAEVTYKKTSTGNVATKILGSEDYYFAVGKWTKPDPISKGKEMGVELDVNCEASSINMATLPYTRWELQGEPGKLILFGKSIGNGQTDDVKTIVTISKSGDKWIMTDDRTKEVYTKE